MNQTRCIVILSILALFVASVSVAGNISLPDASQKVFEGKPCINSPRAIGNYPASPFLFYIPTTGQRPMEWSAEKLPKGLKLDSKTGIITGSVASKGEYTVTLKAKNALGTSTEKLVIRMVMTVADSSHGLEQLEYFRATSHRRVGFANCGCAGSQRNAGFRLFLY